ncbi:peroxiredoxin [Marinitoga sp. 1135]|uniref:Peroxiredoxin n=1 Tax=Marinitoga piezophila (strain DSM 14283 / JCM 11233 / KA3) TaxID=443254 RepID=H2J849_MARPK|nr:MULTISPECIES: peroxiredoxin [Marinitoga]AEX85540.1 peroxiredoxin [Marinitoga piezophila KA3]APT76013.1 peroxiredoxin [Marinitoga sp. 1137]NUU95756.1 peroxiredoxin [Marinitoga sp. 1135]NUU97678.1 peroxiredoxin [Marinitoga sp. 1138]
MANIPLIGEKFPELEVVTTHGVMKLPEAFKGKWFVLFSHPADFTPVCTTEFVGFQKRYDEFKKLNTELIGLSIDQVFSHISWINWIKEKLGVEIKYPVIADDRGIVAEQLGLIHAVGSHTVRAVFIVDPNGIVRAIIYYPPELGRNLDEIIRAVKALQISDKSKAAMPANWPENELIGDKVIIPPAADVKTAEERLKNYEGYDWWFVYKKLED